MNLKLVVTSMSILGLVSCPAFAATNHNKHQQNTQTEARHDYKDYKDMGPKVCTITPSAMTMVEMSQNIGRSLPNPCNPGWYDRIKVSGGINFDFGKFGNRNSNIMGVNYQTFSLNDVYVNIAGTMNEWTTAFASVSFNTASTAGNPSMYGTFGAAEYSAAYSNNVNGATGNNFQIEQAFATIANFNVTPVFLQGGKFFQDFSRYEIHPITRSMTQVMSETLASALRLGFIAEGFNGSAYVFNSPIGKIGSSASSNATNYGLSLGYDVNDQQFGWDLGAGYLYNMMGVNDTAYSVDNFTGGGYNSRAGAAALYGDVNSGPFMVALRYTQAIQRFNRLDLTKNGRADLAAGSPILGSGTQIVPAAGTTGAKPWAAGIQAGYGFDAWGKSQNVYLGYQTSREAAGLNLPKSRWQVGYGVSFVYDTTLTAEWDHDRMFSAGNGGSGNTDNLVSLRAAVKFA